MISHYLENIIGTAQDRDRALSDRMQLAPTPVLKDFGVLYAQFSPLSRLTQAI
jgi:hypothetical protein